MSFFSFYKHNKKPFYMPYFKHTKNGILIMFNFCKARY